MEIKSTIVKLTGLVILIAAGVIYAANRAGASSVLTAPSSEAVILPTELTPTTRAVEGTQPEVQFGSGTVFPSVQMVTYNEKIGVVPLTQIRFAGADVTLRISNKGKTPTDPLWLSVKDTNLLMRQSSPKVSLPRLQPNTSQTVTLHLDAILTTPTSQMPQEKQYSHWNQKYQDSCGVDLRTVLDWRGPQAQTPINNHLETLLTEEGWKTTANSAICDGPQCVKPCQIAKNIHRELDGHAVGYAFFVGQYPKFDDAGGRSRTVADGIARDFTAQTKITVASVSKMVTAIAAVRILEKYGVKLTSPIGDYLPSDWDANDFVRKMTFAKLLGQRSGIMDYGNVVNDYAELKRFFTQPVSTTTSSNCDPRDSQKNLISLSLGKGINPNLPFNQKQFDRCYSNYNFSIFRILLPRVAGLPEDKNLKTRPQTLADQYVKLVQQNVFDLVGQPGVTCKPPSQQPAASTYAFAYEYPGTKRGTDWADNSLRCGADGWYLSVEDIAKVLLSLNAGDGKVLSKNQVEIMREMQLGWDVDTDTEVEKNGGWGANCDVNGKNCAIISTSVALFGPVKGPKLVAVLFINSDISGGPSHAGSAQGVLEKAYKSALAP